MRSALAISVLAALLLLSAPLPAAPPFVPPDETGLGIIPPPGARLPEGGTFRDASGMPAGIFDRHQGAPMVLALAYYTCPNLCGVTLDGIATALKETELRPGADFRLRILSIDPLEGPAEAAAARSKLTARLGSADGVRVLTGDAPSIQRVAQAVGFRYRWDAGLRQYLHPVGVFVLTPDGRVSRWISGAGFEGVDLRLALSEASGGAVGGLTDRLRLLCYHYDPVRGVYDAVVLDALRVGGIATVLVLGAGVGLALWRERRRP